MKQLIVVVMLLGLMAAGPGALLAAEEPSSLVFISYKADEGKPVELQLSFEGAVPAPSAFTTKTPARITLDLPGVKNSLPWTLPLPIKGGGNANSVTAVEASGRTRVVVNMDKLVSYKTRVEGNSLYVELESTPASSQAIEDVNKPDVQAEDESELVAALGESAVSKETASDVDNSVTLKNLKFFSLPGDSVQVRLLFSDIPPSPNSFTIDNPARIVLDLPGIKNELLQPTQNIGVGAAKSVAAIEASGRTRVVLSLLAMRPFTTEVVGNEMVINVEGERGAADTALMAGDGIPYKVSEVDFRRGEKGEGRIAVQLSEPGAAVDTRIVGGKIYVDIMNSEISEDLAQRYDVVDFATPVQFIDVMAEGSKVRMVISTSEEFEHLAYQSDRTFIIDVKKPDMATKVGKADGVYVGEKLSLNFQDIEVRAVLQLIADFTGLNMVASDTVEGNLTLRLKNVPWDQALEIILKTKALDMRQEGNVILVAPADEIAAREKMELEAQRQLSELEPLRTELMQVNYAKATEIAELLKGEEGLMSARGKVSVDERTNTLLVTDVREKREDIRELLLSLDIPIRQVMIDSRIVIASSDFSRDLGARFGVTSVQESGSDLMMMSGSLASTNTMARSAISNTSSSGSPYPIDIPMGDVKVGDQPEVWRESRYNVNLPVAGNAASFGLSILRGDTLLDLELSALQAEGRGEVVSNPRVITSNGKEAMIEQGTEIPYLEASSSGAATVTFKKAVLSLKVTPQITPDDRILMDLQVNKDSVGDIFFDVPSIDTKEVNTQVLVENGDTVVLGGVYEQEKTKIVEKVPLLGDLPILGALFRNTKSVDDKTELLIFVTPKVLKDGMKLH